MLGQQFILAYDGHEMPPEISEFFRRFDIGGVILFADNYADRDHLRDEISKHQRTCAGTKPLFVATDHEGGRVQRFRDGFFNLPTAAELGRLPPDETRALYRRAAMELRDVGVNFNLAPVADVSPEDRPGAVGDRAFHQNPDHVSERVVAAIAGIQSTGLLACAKHFPGHGPTEEDSHATLPIVRKPERVLLAEDGQPFIAAIKAGVGALMTAHCLYPDSGDPHLPASLSAYWITTVLRGRLGFDGLVLSDAIEMTAITRDRTPTEAATLALAAGTDIVIFYLIEEQLRAVHDLCLLAERGGFDDALTKRSLGRIAQAKARCTVTMPRLATDA
jgi:beta-N-acetylhexosaminidase